LLLELFIKVLVKNDTESLAFHRSSNEGQCADTGLVTGLVTGLLTGLVTGFNFGFAGLVNIANINNNN